MIFALDRTIKAKAVSVAGGMVLIADLAQPIAPFAGWIAGVSAISILILLLMSMFVSLGENVKTALLLSASTFVLSTGVWAVQNSSEAHEQGLLGGNLAVVSDFQQAIGIAESIADNTAIIAKNTNDIKNVTQEVSDKVGKLKTEISDDPRKELANLGYKWGEAQGLLGAVRQQDLPIIELFLRGGKNPARLGMYSAVYEAVFGNDGEYYTEAMQLFIKYGFDINLKFDMYPAGSRSGTLLEKAIGYMRGDHIKDSITIRGLSIIKHLIKDGAKVDVVSLNKLEKELKGYRAQLDHAYLIEKICKKGSNITRDESIQVVRFSRKRLSPYANGGRLRSPYDFRIKGCKSSVWIREVKELNKTISGYLKTIEAVS